MTPFDNLGGLLGLDPETIKQLAAAMSVSDADRQSANRDAIAQAGFSLLGTRKGQEWDRVGFAGQNAMMARQASLQGAQQAKAQQMQMMEHFGKLKQNADARKQEAEFQAQLAPVFSNAPRLQNMGDGGPTPQNAQAVAPSSRGDQYRQAAAMYAARGNHDAAKKMSDIAASMDEEYSTKPEVVRGDDGKLRLVQFGKRGGKLAAEGMSPAEKLHFSNTGQMVGVGQNPYTGEAVFSGLQATMDPAQADASKRGWAQFGLAQNADRRAGEAAKQGAAGQLVQDADGNYVRVNGNSATPVTMGGQPLQGKGEKPTDQQLTTASFLSRMRDASKVINEIEDKGYAPGMTEASLASFGKLPLVGGGFTAVTNYAQGKLAPEIGQYKQGRRGWIRAKLRKESGAVIGKEEEDEEDRTFFPQPGDSPELIAQKRLMRERVEKSFEGAARGAAPKAEGGPIKSQAEYDQLPVGATYIGPDGKTRRKQ